MAGVSQAFGKHQAGPLIRGPAPQEVQQDNEKPPWDFIKPDAMPPMMFQLRFHDGTSNSFQYSDLREVYRRDAGYFTLLIQSIAKYRVEIEGRHLGILPDMFGRGRVCWIQEADPRSDPKPEAAPEILRISVELIPD